MHSSDCETVSESHVFRERGQVRHDVRLPAEKHGQGERNYRTGNAGLLASSVYFAIS